MSAEEAADHLNELAKLIAESLPDLTQIAATTGLAKVRERIQETGMSAENTAFPDYDPKYKKRKAEGKIKGQGPRTVSHRDLTLSGEMWRRTRIIETGATSIGYEVIVGGSDTLTKNKMEGNANIVGDFLEPSNEEVEILKQDFDEQLQEIIDKSGL